MVEIEPGVVYAPPGGGVMTSGISQEAARLTMMYHKVVDNIQKHLEDNIDQIIRENSIKDFDGLDVLDFELQIVDDKFYAIEKSTSIAINYGNIR